MSFDGFLFVSSRVMVANLKEAHTSFVKDLIIPTACIEDAAWEGTYTRPTMTGGILTALLELGEPIYKVVTQQAVKLWKEFDDTVPVFKLLKEKQCQNLKVGRGYGVTCRVHHRSFQVDKTWLQLMCCALVQEPGCLVISEGRSPECGAGFPEWT